MAYRFTNKTTEKCPKCGADVEGNVKYCPFCILPLGLLTYGIIRIAKDIGEGTR